MTIFGWDASDYDWGRGPMDLAAAARAGIQFFTHKATEGSPGTGTAFRHTHYAEAMRRARDAGIPVLGAYHVVRSPADAAAEVDFHLDYVTRETPWWRDWPGWCWQVDLEKWPYDSVPAAEGEAFADIIADRTGRPALIYASRGQYGSQLTGTSHPTWNADYGTNPAVDFRALYDQRGGDSGPGWQAYSGQTPSIWQYGSRAVIGRQSTCDANAIRDPAVWAALIGDDMTDEQFADLKLQMAAIEQRSAAIEQHLVNIGDAVVRVVHGVGAILGNDEMLTPGSSWGQAENRLHDVLVELKAKLDALSARPPGAVDPEVVRRAVAEVVEQTHLTVRAE